MTLDERFMHPNALLFSIDVHYTELMAETDRDGVVDKENMKHGIGV